MKLVVTVETVKTEGGVAAGVVVYPVNTAAPVFVYTDRQGRRRTVGLEEFHRLSDVYRVNILRYLRQNSLSHAVIGRRDTNRQAAACLAVARALERLNHFCPEMLGSRGSVEVVTARPLPEEQVGFLSQRVAKGGWMSLAAMALAKSKRVRTVLS